jgi:hypothetical protein
VCERRVLWPSADLLIQIAATRLTGNRLYFSRVLVDIDSRLRGISSTHYQIVEQVLVLRKRGRGGCLAADLLDHPGIRIGTIKVLFPTRILCAAYPFSALPQICKRICQKAIKWMGRLPPQGRSVNLDSFATPPICSKKSRNGLHACYSLKTKIYIMDCKHFEEVLPIAMSLIRQLWSNGCIATLFLEHILVFLEIICHFSIRSQKFVPARIHHKLQSLMFRNSPQFFVFIPREKD